MTDVHFTLSPRADVFVMREQFDYLVEHFRKQREGIHCRSGCQECVRYHEMRLTLLWPFRIPKHGSDAAVKARHA